MCASEEEGSSADGRRLSPASRNLVSGQNVTDTPPRQRWLAGPFVRLLATNMTFGFAISCFYLLPKHLTAHYAASPGEVGAVMGIFGLISVLLVPWLGRAVTAFGLARTIVASELLLGTSCLGFAFAGGPGPAMLVLRALQGVATAGMMTAAVALVCELAPAARLGQAMGLSGAASLVMNALAPAIAEPVAARFGFAAVFVMAGFAGLLGAALARRLPSSASTADAATRAGAVLGVPRKARALLLALAAVGAGFYVAIAFLAPLALSRGVHAVRGFFVAYTVAALAIRLFGGPLTERLGLARTAMAGMVVYGLFIALLAGMGKASLAPLGVGFGLAHGVLFPALMALLFEDADRAARAHLAAIANGVMNAGLLSVLLFGQLANHVGLPAVFVVTGLLVATAARLVPGTAAEETAATAMARQPEAD